MGSALGGRYHYHPSKFLGFQGCPCGSLTMCHCHSVRPVCEVSRSSHISAGLRGCHSPALSAPPPPRRLSSPPPPPPHPMQFCFPPTAARDPPGSERAGAVPRLPIPLTEELGKRVPAPEELPEDLLGAAEGEGETRPTSTSTASFCPGGASSWRRGRMKRELKACNPP